jgi:cytochrome c
MSSLKRSSLTFIALFLLLVSSLTRAGESGNAGNAHLPGLGQEIESYKGSIISPDGSGLPAGNGTVADGKILYERQCVACHGIDGGQPGNQLAGGIGSLSTSRPLKTVGSFWPYATTLYDYIARAMPYNQEKTLSVNEVYAITAYVLNLNKILNDDAVVNDRSLPAIIMPNREGFIELIH